MAFNFNWSPLIADTERVRDMLTSALNKSPKPPIIVDDIIVNELNLGSTPPELEILEIGDLAEDRFRGIFKMSYTGDAYLTLKTRVQANPLNTYLSTKPSFASPQPLAASSSLTIPIQITLSEIRLSGFVILVFSKQKGITIVFRNDPLEKLKVSSTFDSIPFVREYLQKTIENQLRTLFMEDLPAIIHRLSLQKFSPEYQTAHPQNPKRSAHGRPVDPFANPALFDDEVNSQPFTLDPPAETYASFSQKNMVRLATLMESQKTLSLSTPSVRDTVYRAWASAYRDDFSNGTHPPTRPVTLSRLQSSIALHSAVSAAASPASGAGSEATGPSFASTHSAATVSTLGSGISRSRPGKKRKHRVVDLRKNRDEKDNSDILSRSSGYDDGASQSMGESARSRAVKSSTEAATAPSSELREGEITTPPRSPEKSIEHRNPDRTARVSAQPAAHSQPQPPKDILPPAVAEHLDPTPRASAALPGKGTKAEKPPSTTRNQFPDLWTFPSRPASPELRRSCGDNSRASSDVKLHRLLSAFSEGRSGGILEQAWIQKMASEIATKAEQERAMHTAWRAPSDDGLREGEEAPPAYVT